LATTKEAAERKEKLGLGTLKRRGFGFEPLPDQSNPEYTEQQRLDDATKIHIGQCVCAYREQKLNATNPIPTKSILPAIRQVGGNVKWLSLDERRRRIFHVEYCRLLGRSVPYEKVWQNHQQRSPANVTPSVLQKRTKAQKRLE
jgi:hypothetical protein